MNNDSQESGAGRFHSAVQPHRDLESNWAVDLAKNLEEYLLKICSGEITGRDDTHFSINFAEAALLLQGSIQVYSRKVEYLYSLVLHALEFISQKRSQDQEESSKAQPEASSSHAAGSEDNDQFWCPDDIPVETKNSLDSATGHASLNHFVKPPANLVVLEGDGFDSAGDVGELESYLLATCNLYRDFILLDPCDAAAVDGYLKDDKAGEGQDTTYKGSSRAPKTFQSPLMQSVGTARKSSHKKKQDNICQNDPVGCGLENHNGFGPDPGACGVFDSGNDGYGMDDHCSEPGGLNSFDVDDDDDDEDDPWKPLNPHEPGNLKVKPFRKVKISRRHGPAKQKSVNVDFPLAKLRGPISPELTQLWEKLIRARQKLEPHSPPFCEKLRESLIHGGNVSHEAFVHPGDDNDDDDALNDFQQPDFDMPDAMYMDEHGSFPQEQHDGFVNQFGGNDAKGPEDPSSQASLEDLCRSHLDSLLASIAETEKQTELATRVSTWKQNIEHNLEEQESRPPFDIHEYGARIIDKLSLQENENVLSFVDVVMGQEKHDVARSFSALLQLVNEGKVELDRSMAGGDTFCYTSSDPFYLRLLSSDREPEKVQQKMHIISEREAEKMQQKKSKKRPKSPVQKRNKKGADSQREQRSVVSSPSSASKSTESVQNHCKSLSLKLGKTGILRCTPESKRRRPSRFVEPVNLHHAG